MNYFDFILIILPAHEIRFVALGHQATLTKAWSQEVKREAMQHGVRNFQHGLICDERFQPQGKFVGKIYKFIQIKFNNVDF